MQGYKKMKKEVTLKDVAKYAKVSAMTVSRVIHNKDNVSPKLRRRVEKAIKELNYIPNDWARSFRSKKSRLVGLIVRDITNPYYSNFVRVLENTMRDYNLSLLFYDSREKYEFEKQAIELLLRKRVAGMIIVPYKERITSSYIEELKSRNIPFVLLGKLLSTKTDCITFRDVEGAYIATKYLIELGHRDILHIRGPEDVIATELREKGFKEALRENGIKLEKYSILEGGTLREHGYRAVKEFLVSKNPLPSAIFTFNDLVAIGAMRALREKKLRIPEDVSIVGFDDIEDASYTYPPLTTIRQPAEEMAKAAVSLLLEQIEGKRKMGEYKEVSFSPVLIKRESCRRV